MESRVGQGSTFWFTLPLKRDERQDESRPAVSTRDPSRTPVESRIRVLLAEDNLVNQKVAAGMLKRLGLQPDVAINGVDALEKCARLPYDVVFMDCQMPEMDGYDAAGELRRREGAGRRTAIIALTTDARSGTRESCIAAGMDDYLVKPIKIEDLRDMIRRWAPATR